MNYMLLPSACPTTLVPLTELIDGLAYLSRTVKQFSENVLICLSRILYERSLPLYLSTSQVSEQQ